MSVTPEDMKEWIGMFASKQFADGVCYIIGAFGNVGAVETHEGLILFDITMKQFGSRAFKTLRNFTDKPIKYIIYSHGHFDHSYGFGPFINEIKKKGWEMPQIIAHENCVKRFNKYKMLDNYHNWLNKQQFASIAGKQKDVVSPHETLDPTIILHGNESYSFKLGQFSFEIFHDKGETDDSLWMFFPEKKVLFAGDLMVSSYPNVGNPYKVQRYPKDWAIAMERMLEKNAEYLLPGHGRLIEGKDKVKEVLSITAEAMHFVHDEVVKRMNEGKWFEQIYHEMLDIFPEKFNHWILQPIYGCYRFAIHAVYRLYHGWYNTGNPTDLFPAKSEEIAKEFLKIANETNYINHAKKLFDEGKVQLALHMIDVVIKGIKSNNNDILLDAYNLKYKILKQKAKDEPSFIASNIINNGALQIKDKIKKLKKAPL
ncbi:MAG: alkyl sulfatase dimerization domain-containing protein [Promethearchaeota archaeon]